VLAAKGPVASAPSANSAAAPVQVAITPDASFGSWHVTAGQDRRPIATSQPDKRTDLPLQGRRLECVAGGCLEYVPVSGKAEAFKSVWISGMDDLQSKLPLANGRITGKSASWLSQELLKAESNAAKSGQKTWGPGIVAGDPNSETTDIVGSGFSQMRGYMLAHFKS
jgi:hypothetical protein